MNRRDYERFVHNLYVFNDSKASLHSGDRFNAFCSGLRTDIEDTRDLLVTIHAFCLMPNHYHMVLSPIKEKGISLFMKKINMGYAKYFNKKNKRSGALFQGKYKGIPIKTDRHFSFIHYYVHFNPLDLFDREWRSRLLNNMEGALSFLDTYEWSSYHDYIGTRTYSRIVDTDFFAEVVGRGDEYRKNVTNTLKAFSTDLTEGSSAIILE